MTNETKMMMKFELLPNEIISLNSQLKLSNKNKTHQYNEILIVLSSFTLKTLFISILSENLIRRLKEMMTRVFNSS
jgi:hypothetical protein